MTAAPRLRILSGCFTNGVFRLIALGGPSASCQVQARADLATTNWQTLGSVTADNAGTILYDDTAATNYSRRFYRLSP